MEAGTAIQDYVAPTIVELGTFTSLTATSFDGGLHFAQVQIGSLGTPTPTASPVTTVTPPGGEVLPGGATNPNDTGSGGTGGAGAVLGETATGAIPVSGGGGGGPSGGGGDTPGNDVVGSTGGGSGSGNSLPFTGFAVGTLAAAGAAATSAGVALRRLVRRR